MLADGGKTWITATQAMYLIGEFEPGKSILWHAGASAVSISGQQLSKGNGASAVVSDGRQAHNLNESC
jgi:NADPH:quinone reductase-like Zn-dependent oxidoreductase